MVSPGQKKFYFPKGPPPGEICRGENSLVTPWSALVKRNFIFQRDPPHARIALVRIPWSRRGLPWCQFLGHAGVNPGQKKFYFPKGPPPTREFLCENSLVTPWSALVKRNFFCKGPPPRENSLGENSLVTPGSALVPIPWSHQCQPW